MSVVISDGSVAQTDKQAFDGEFDVKVDAMSDGVSDDEIVRACPLTVSVTTT